MIIYRRQMLLAAGSVWLDQQEGLNSSVGKNDAKHHRYHLSRQNSAERWLRGCCSHQHHPISHGCQFEDPATRTLCGGVLNARGLLKCGCEANCTRKGINKATHVLVYHVMSHCLEVAHVLAHHVASPHLKVTHVPVHHVMPQCPEVTHVPGFQSKAICMCWQ